MATLGITDCFTWTSRLPADTEAEQHPALVTVLSAALPEFAILRARPSIG